MRRDSFPDRTVLTPTQARQATPQRTNLVVLTVSMLVLTFLGAALIAAFYGSAPEKGGTTPGPASTVEAPVANPPAGETKPDIAPKQNP